MKMKRKIRWWHFLIIGLVTALILMFSAPWWNPIVFPPIKNPVMGVSFSDKRSRELGLDWQANYIALLDDMQIRNFRLMSYWDEYEKSPAQYDFTTLDWQINEATKRGATVSLSIGLRQPRWPECHEPAWAATLGGNEWKQALYSYIEVVLKRYEKNSTVINWQLENEGANNWFGKCGAVDAVRLVEEFNLVKTRTQKPVWMSLSDQHGLPVNAPLPDAFGYSVYRVIWSNKTGPYVGYLTYPTPIWYHRLRAAIIKAYTGRDVFIHELQLEPWGYSDTKNLTIAEQDKSMNLSQIHDNMLFGREIGAKDIYLWGGEWWYWRKETLKDPSVWEKVRSELNVIK